ncbi:hypothetical protein [Streptomyces sp. NPDC005408]|uniref:hypothetical protein n=1 Tax=Streptomyces sp. NPDC005408 TaxID=3155341 RepID=UPI0033B42EED
MTLSAPDMMTVRRSALDAIADLPPAAVPRRPFEDIQVDVNDHLSPTDAGTDAVPASLARAVADRLVRHHDRVGPGAAVVTGLASRFGLGTARVFHEALFREVWEEFRSRTGRPGPEGRYRFKTTVTSDGAIPLELYGSNWSFKRPHIDRDTLVFSHLYGPLSGFSGGGLLLVDVRVYMHRHGLRFKDVFEWSDEPTEGSKPVLRHAHLDAALDECAVDLGAMGPDEILFVNNSPDAGILHGVTDVIPADRGDFVRTFHRCSVKESERGGEDA